KKVSVEPDESLIRPAVASERATYGKVRFRANPVSSWLLAAARRETGRSTPNAQGASLPMRLGFTPVIDSAAASHAKPGAIHATLPLALPGCLGSRRRPSRCRPDA